MSDVASGGAPASAPVAAPAADTSQTQQKQPAQASPLQAAPPSTKKKFNIKVDGQDESVDLDLANDDEIRKHLQMSKVSQKRMQQFSEYEKGVRGLFEQLKTDPLKVLGDPRLGIPEATRRKLAESIINNEIEEMQKSPEQRERERVQREFEALKKQHEEERKGRETAEFARMQDQAAVSLDSDISAAIESAKLPKTARTVKYMAEALMLAMQNDLDLTAQDVLPYVQSQILSDFREIIGSLPDEDFEEWLGKDQITRIRKRTLQKIKNVATSNTKSTGETSEKHDNKKPEKKIPMRDFFKNLGK